MDKNKEFGELAGICWHEIVRKDEYTKVCSCGEDMNVFDAECQNPNYAADQLAVLRVMRKRKDWDEFTCRCPSLFRGRTFVDVDLLFDTTGKLRDLAIEWLRERKEQRP